ncbi:hypothetical protein GGX14DRAFT_409174 [Mycena pura]|uniref:Uncharacterized protein n=1 Tax=Mycena pura TaxID=153505 RepID=A0AAD6ULG6_9AGAR|nr:hypothetical protein GGX14DRAFT_409174 [Mycena pura]
MVEAVEQFSYLYRHPFPTPPTGTQLAASCSRHMCQVLRSAGDQPPISQFPAVGVNSLSPGPAYVAASWVDRLGNSTWSTEREGIHDVARCGRSNEWCELHPLWGCNSQMRKPGRREGCQAGLDEGENAPSWRREALKVCVGHIDRLGTGRRHERQEETWGRRHWHGLGGTGKLGAAGVGVGERETRHQPSRDGCFVIAGATCGAMHKATCGATHKAKWYHQVKDPHLKPQ